jgi:hypothetical protein
MPCIKTRHLIGNTKKNYNSRTQFDGSDYALSSIITPSLPSHFSSLNVKLKANEQTLKFEIGNNSIVFPVPLILEENLTC